MTELLTRTNEFQQCTKYLYEKRNCPEKKYKVDNGLNFYRRTYNNTMKHRIIMFENGFVKNNEIELYLEKIANKFEKIQIDEKKLSGMPLIKNTRIPVSLIAACLKDEMTFEEICEEYNITKEDIEESMEYVIEVLDSPYQEG